MTVLSYTGHNPNASFSNTSLYLLIKSFVPGTQIYLKRYSDLTDSPLASELIKKQVVLKADQWLSNVVQP